MSVDAAVTRFRRRQAAQFTDRATIRRPVGEMTFDESTGLASQEYETVGTNRPCKFVRDDRAGRDVTAGDTTVLVASIVCRFPVEEDVELHDVLTVTASAYNPTDVGRSWRVADLERHTWQIARNCVVEEIVAPALNEEEGS
jgi:hypothetical protein